MKIAYLLLLVSSTLMAVEEYSVEENFNNPIKLPALINSYVTKKLSKDIVYCQDEKHTELFEAKVVSLNKSSKAYLVKPAQMCLCGVYYCPMWMFQPKGTEANLIWSTGGTSALEILPKKTNGYRQLKAYGGTAMHGYESVLVWKANKYREIYRKEYTVDNDRLSKCTETYHLKGKMLVSVSNKCLPL